MLEEYLRSLHMVPIKPVMIYKPSSSYLAAEEFDYSGGLGRSEKAPLAAFGRVSGDICSRPSLPEPLELGMKLFGMESSGVESSGMESLFKAASSGSRR